MSLFARIRDGDCAGALALVRSGAAVDVNERGTDGPPPADGGATCLLAAIRSFAPGDLELVQELLNRGADANLADTQEQETPIQAAARFHAYETAFIDALLAKGADPERTNKHGDTALHVAASAGAAISAAHLVKRGANYKTKDRKGKTAIEIAQDVACKSSIQEAIDGLGGKQQQ